MATSYRAGVGDAWIGASTGLWVEKLNDHTMPRCLDHSNVVVEHWTPRSRWPLVLSTQAMWISGTDRIRSLWISKLSNDEVSHEGRHGHASAVDTAE
ncbi:hypothetical protein Tdes44962_MAKER07802 [Teratosphaeria destructans]|uniref:Uncharacterized protein n=1 Tax=Teratosphaeria destructans TaxID=418781 RepID=A0A9W7W5Q3_9PEZI|nr:hypothetical protein Tdes44962_MAKER07802 [Teratosphaeria destructans]